MSRIIILDENTSNKIAAGEVVERPASVVKELVENSIDAGADSISVEIKNGGISYIKVADNGSGMEADDVEIAFERHSTSKIRSAGDLDSISTFGFRGEALASIASVSIVQLTTRTKSNTHGVFLEVQGGRITEKRQAGCPVGTSFSVRDLFFNTPARYKFLKKDSTEAGYISDIVERIALGNPHISFRLTNNGSTVLHTPGNNDLQSAIFSIYGREVAKKLSQIHYEDSGVRITGYAGKPEIARANRNHQSVFINGRYIRNKTVTAAVDEAYKTLLMKNRFAFIVLKIDIDPLWVDVNVHPGKMEVRFSNEQEVFRHVYHAVNSALLVNSALPDKTGYLAAMDLQYHRDNSVPDSKSPENTGGNANAADISEGLQKNMKRADMPCFTQQELDIRKFSVNEERGADIRESNGDTRKERIAAADEEKNAGTGEEKNTGISEAAVSEYDFKSSVNEGGGEEALRNDRGYSLMDMKIIGQVFLTYIIFQHGDRLILLDQHAAHERILYEKLRRKYNRGESMAQILAAPVVIELTHREIEFLGEEKEFFGKLGFVYEYFGNNSIVLRSVPYELAGNDSGTRSAFLEVADTAMIRGGNRYSLTADETLYTVACKAAVKANKRLDEMEIRGILEELEKMDNPFTCPHGRPTVVEISKHELEKMFKRIV